MALRKDYLLRHEGKNHGGKLTVKSVEKKPIMENNGF